MVSFNSVTELTANIAYQSHLNIGNINPKNTMERYGVFKYKAPTSN